MNPNEQLIRPHDLQQTIQDALGAPIAWPRNLVLYLNIILIGFFGILLLYVTSL